MFVRPEQFVFCLEQQPVCLHVGHVSRKVVLRWAGEKRATGKRVNGSKTFDVMPNWRTLTGGFHDGHSYVLAWPESNCGAKL